MFTVAISENTVDVELTTQMVKGIHNIQERLDNPEECLQPWGRQVKPFSSLHKKIADYKEEMRRNQENKSSNPFTPVGEDKSEQKRNRKYRKLGMGYSVLSTVGICAPQ